MSGDLRFDPETHFAFGKNWAEYSQHILEEDVEAAQRELTRMLCCDSLEGKSFLDIGCGSGLHALAALRLGAASVYSIDIDPASVATTRSVLEKFWGREGAVVERRNILSEEAALLPQSDVVYSWGVLHHTGDMWNALDRAASRVKPGGLLAIALYRKTRLCWLWALEKRLYVKAGPLYQKPVLWAFLAAKILRDVLRLKNPLKKIRRFGEKKRGMRWTTNAIDWLGGYPYESATPEEVRAFLEARGFEWLHAWKTRRELGVFGTGCAEYLLRRRGPPASG